jgi:tetratricopeptide (TPR) repeat protein
MPPIARAEQRFLAFLLLGALLLHLVYIYEYRASPFFDAPVVDARTFLAQAQLIAAGDLLGGDEPFWQPPLYIYLLAFVCWLFPQDYFTSIRLLQAAFSALSCGLIYLLARRVFDMATARLAAIAYLLCGTFLYFGGELLAVPIEISLNLLLLYCLSHALDRDARSDWLWAGVLAGLAALTRPNILLFIALFALWWMYYLRSRNEGRWARLWLTRLALFALPMFSIILPVTLRNLTLESDLVFISANGGVNFYLGNSGDYDAKVSTHPGMHWENMVMEPVRAGRETAAAKSAYFFRKSFAYIGSHPLDYAQLLLKKAYLFWSGPELKRNQDIYYARQHSHLLSALLWDKILSYPFGLIGPLALVGLALTWRQKGTELLRLYTLSYTLSVLLFFAVARYRMPALPIFIIFAARATTILYHDLQHAPFNSSLRPLVALAILLIALNLPAAPRGKNDAQLHSDLGEVHLRKGHYAEASKYLKQALQLEPDYNYARHNLAVAYFRLNQYQESIETGLRTLEENPRRPDTHLLLSRAYGATQQYQKARHYLRRTLEIDPQNGMAHYDYGHLLYKEKNYSKAIFHLRRASEWNTHDAWTHYELGRALHHLGEESAALHAYQRAWQIEPPLPAAANAIGSLHFVAGRLQQARLYFSRALDRAPDNLEAQINLGLLDVEEGYISKGIERLQQLRDQYPNSSTARNALREVQQRAEQTKR